MCTHGIGINGPTGVSGLIARVPGVNVALTKVLVVDDDEESRELLREVLAANGYAADAVENVKAALQKLNQDDAEYRIVVADLRMPDGTGLELLQDLRRRNRRHEIILMSSFISATERQLALKLGADALLDKPFRLSELLQAVGELAARNAISISR